MNDRLVLAKMEENNKAVLEIKGLFDNKFRNLELEVRALRQGTEKGMENIHSDLKSNMEITNDIHSKVNVLAPKDKIKLTRIIDRYIKDAGVKPEFYLEAREWIKNAFVPNGLYKNMSIDDLLEYETADANLINAFTREIIELTNLMQQRKLHQGWIQI